MNWRTEIKELFRQKIEEVTDIISFSSWNSQRTNSENEDTEDYPRAYFYFNAIGDMNEYLNTRDTKQAAYTAVNVSIHIAFSNHDDVYQDLAYSYACDLIQKCIALKSECIHGRVLKLSESEDINHDSEYYYEIVFRLNVFDVYGVDDEAVSIDSNPETGENPATGRKLFSRISASIDDNDV